MNGEDVRAVLEGKVDLVALLRDKISALSLKGEPFLAASITE